MKIYDVYPLVWNDAISGADSDTYNARYFNTYKQAVAYAKRLSKTNIGATLNCYQLNKSDCDNEQEFETEWEYNKSAHLKWTEQFAGGKQCPAAIVDGREIWRWGMSPTSGNVFEDLKPRNLIK